jgi:hypothetical protein
VAPPVAKGRAAWNRMARRFELADTLISGRFPRRWSAARLADLRAASERALEKWRSLYNWLLQSRIANTTIVVIAISLTAVAILWYRWWESKPSTEPSAGGQKRTKTRMDVSCSVLKISVASRSQGCRRGLS